MNNKVFTIREIQERKPEPEKRKSRISVYIIIEETR